MEDSQTTAMAVVDVSNGFIQYSGKPCVVYLFGHEKQEWFDCRCIADILGINHLPSAMDRVDPASKCHLGDLVSGLGQPEILGHANKLSQHDLRSWAVDEPGMYELTFGSKKVEAVAFRRWVCREVLPQIRKTGTYSAPAVQQGLPSTDAIQSLRDSIAQDMKRHFDALQGMVIMPAKKQKTVQRNKEASQLRNIVTKGLKDYVGTGKPDSAAALHTAQLVQTSIEHFRKHMEEQFEAGMVWWNHGNADTEWAVGHKKPVAAYDLKDEAQVAECFHYSNLFPQWSRWNRKESDRMPDGTLGRHKRKDAEAAEEPPQQGPVAALPPAPVEEDKRGSLERFLDSDKLVYGKEHRIEDGKLWYGYKQFCKQHKYLMEEREMFLEDMLQTALKKKVTDGVHPIVDNGVIYHVNFAAKVRQQEEVAMMLENAGYTKTMRTFLMSGVMLYHPLAQIARKDLFDEYKAFCKREKLRMEKVGSEMVLDAFAHVTAKRPGVSIVPHGNWMGFVENGVNMFKGLDVADRGRAQFRSTGGAEDVLDNIAHAVAAAAEGAAVRAAANTADHHQSTDAAMMQRLINM